FVLSMFAELIANDRPLMLEYEGQYYFPIVQNLPESTFGGFLPQTDYRDPFIQEEVASKGWMLWPPIRYSYRTINLELPVPAPSPPFWMMSAAERCAAYPLGVDDPNCVMGNLN